MIDTNMVFVQGVKADETMRIVRELRETNLTQGLDFDFKYLQGEFITTDGDYINKPCGAEFYFREGKWATYFTLKYGK